MNNILTVYLMLTIVAVAICIICSIFKKTKLLILAAIIALLFGIRTGAIAINLSSINTEAPEELEAPTEQPNISLTLPTFNYEIDNDRIGFGLDGYVSGTKKQTSEATEELADTIKTALTEVRDETDGSSPEVNESVQNEESKTVEDSTKIDASNENEANEPTEESEEM